jgi:hypothetical protein
MITSDSDGGQQHRSGYDRPGLGHGLETRAYLELAGTIRTNTVAGIAFDGYAANDFKFAAIDVVNQKVLIGHVSPKRGWVIDVSVNATLSANTNYTMSLILGAPSVSVSLNGRTHHEHGI